MARNDRIQHLQKEHENFLRLAHTIEKMLELASKNAFAGHLKGLKGLRSLDRGFVSIEKHCHAERFTIDSIYHDSLQEQERERIDAEHEQLIWAVKSFHEELKYATADRTMAMILPGIDVVHRLRAHIAYERELLGRIAPSSRAQETIQRKRQKSKRPLGTNSKPTRKRRIFAKTTHVPYTLEPHPEL